jgi:hypothetical protein
MNDLLLNCDSLFLSKVRLVWYVYLSECAQKNKKVNEWFLYALHSHPYTDIEDPLPDPENSLMVL